MSIERKAETDRDRFEAHYRKTRGGVPDYVFDKGLSNNRYFILAVQLDWELWKTAITASGRDELLEALEAILKDDEEYPTWIERDLIEEAKLAIAKAKGEQ
jgi:hypothetical protein